jgi:hypothetical protein
MLEKVSCVSDTVSGTRTAFVEVFLVCALPVPCSVVLFAYQDAACGCGETEHLRHALVVCEPH